MLGALKQVLQRKLVLDIYMLVLLSYILSLKLILFPALPSELIFKQNGEVLIFFSWLLLWIYLIARKKFILIFPQSMILIMAAMQILTQDNCPSLSVCVS